LSVCFDVLSVEIDSFRMNFDARRVNFHPFSVKIGAYRTSFHAKRVKFDVFSVKIGFRLAGKMGEWLIGFKSLMLPL
jgi:hypothetical protein